MGCECNSVHEWAVLDVSERELALVDYCAECHALTGFVRVERVAS